MSHIERMLNLAAEVSRSRQDDRRFCLGAVGLRADGVTVWACNGNPKEPDFHHHAEFRLSRKLTKGSDVFVARTTADGKWALAKPCNDCLKRLQVCKVSTVYWTVGQDSWSKTILL